MKKFFVNILLLACSLSVFSLFAQNKKQNASFDNFIKKGMTEWQIPGLTVSVIQKGQVLFSGAYGITSLESKTQVRNDTRFMIGSTTKAMTAFGLALLVEDGKIGWDDPVILHLPEFRLKDPWVTREITIRDLLVHHAGLGNADFLWFIRDISPTEIVSKLELIEPAYSFRNGWVYQNIMYGVAGQVIERVSGLSWAEYMKKRIFNPLGMFRTVPLSEERLKDENYVKPHYKIDGKISEIDGIYAGKVAPAGDVWSTIVDMSKWAAFLLDSCKLNGKRMVSEKIYKELFTPQNIVPPSQYYPTMVLTNPRWTTYALGWFQQDYRGKALSFHTGSLPGLIAIIGLVPDEDFGVVVMGNLDHAELRHAIMLKAIDLYLEKDDSRDWLREIYDLYDVFEKPNPQNIHGMVIWEGDLHHSVDSQAKYDLQDHK